MLESSSVLECSVMRRLPPQRPGFQVVLARGRLASRWTCGGRSASRNAASWCPPRGAALPWVPSAEPVAAGVGVSLREGRRTPASVQAPGHRRVPQEREPVLSSARSIAGGDWPHSQVHSEGGGACVASADAVEVSDARGSVPASPAAAPSCPRPHSMGTCSVETRRVPCHRSGALPPWHRLVSGEWGSLRS